MQEAAKEGMTIIWIDWSINSWDWDLVLMNQSLKTQGKYITLNEFLFDRGFRFPPPPLSESRNDLRLFSGGGHFY